MHGNGQSCRVLSIVSMQTPGRNEDVQAAALRPPCSGCPLLSYIQLCPDPSSSSKSVLHTIFAPSYFCKDHCHTACLGRPLLLSATAMATHTVPSPTLIPSASSPISLASATAMATSSAIGAAPPYANGDSSEGASGTDTGFIHVSSGSQVAIIVVVVVVAAFGRECQRNHIQTAADKLAVGSALLFYLAKKRQWEVRKSLRRSARRLTGSFKTSGQTASRKQRGLSRITETPLPPLSRRQDVEKGNTTTITSTFEVESPTTKSWRQALAFGKKTGR